MEKTNKTTDKIYNLIIMDRSGSMESIAHSAISGFNEVLHGVQASAKKFEDTQEQLISLVLFDSTSIDNVCWNEDPMSVAELNRKTYVPGACTPLYDAMGMSLTRLEKEAEESAAVIVTVITDGLENASKEYSGSSIRALIERLKAKGWSFAYMGTDHDVTGVSMSLSITNVIAFQKNEAQTRAAFDCERRARERYSDTIRWIRLKHPEATEAEMREFKTKAANEYYDGNSK